MRTGGAFEAESMPPQVHNHTAAAAAATGWKSPVPYLFGGLAAMLGLIAFALLILACSYWKLSGYLDGENAGENAGDEKPKEAEKASVFLNSVLVIMPGEERPTRIATPATSGASSCGDDGKASCSSGGGDGGEKEGRREKEVELSGGGGVDGVDHNTATTTTTSSPES